jgi:hypothetical protein
LGQSIGEEVTNPTPQLHIAAAAGGQHHQQDEHVDNSREGRRYQGIASEASRQPGIGLGWRLA